MLISCVNLSLKPQAPFHGPAANHLRLDRNGDSGQCGRRFFNCRCSIRGSIQNPKKDELWIAFPASSIHFVDADESQGI